MKWVLEGWGPNNAWETGWLGDQPPKQSHSTAFSHFLFLILKEYGEKQDRTSRSGKPVIKWPKANVYFFGMFHEGTTWRCEKEREHLIIAFQWWKQKSSTDMIIEFGLDGQNLRDPTDVFSKPFAWLLIHVLRFVSFARFCIWKLLITSQACSSFLCHYLVLPLLHMKMFCLHYFSGFRSLT